MKGVSWFKQICLHVTTLNKIDYPANVVSSKSVHEYFNKNRNHHRHDHKICGRKSRLCTKPIFSYSYLGLHGFLCKYVPTKKIIYKTTNKTNESEIDMLISLTTRTWCYWNAATCLLKCRPSAAPWMSAILVLNWVDGSCWEYVCVCALEIGNLHGLNGSRGGRRYL